MLIPFFRMRVNRKAIMFLALVSTALVGLTPAAGVGATTAAAAKPTNLKIVINGHTLTAAQTAAGADTYLNVRAGRLTVGARWIGKVQGSGYYVLIVDSGSTDKRRCRVGTTCTVVSSKGIRKTQEMNWSIQIIRSSTGVLASQKIICLAGVA